MSFTWPWLLSLLVLVPALAAAYVWAQRRRQRFALRFSSLSLVREAAAKGPGWRRHLPAALYLTAITFVIVATSRPAATVLLPANQGMIVLAMDNSGSMRAQDVNPSRFDAAKAAARSFVERQPGTSRIGVVSFAGTAALVQPPTRDRAAVMAAIDRLYLQRGTAIGSGIVTSLNAILEDLGEAPLTLENEDPNAAAVPLGGSDGFAPAIVVLLSDGQSNTGPPPMAVADRAAARGVRIYTVGLGSPDGAIIEFYGRSVRVRLDEETLKAIARRTDGEYFRATSESDLRQIYEALGTKLVFKPVKTEITALFAAFAGLLMLTAGVLSLKWFNRLP